VLAKIPLSSQPALFRDVFVCHSFLPIFIFSSFQDISEGIAEGNYLCLSVDCVQKRPVWHRAEDLYPDQGD
jgi:hypothetical protein